MYMPYKKHAKKQRGGEIAYTPSLAASADGNATQPYQQKGTAYGSPGSENAANEGVADSNQLNDILNTDPSSGGQGGGSASGDAACNTEDTTAAAGPPDGCVKAADVQENIRR